MNKATCLLSSLSFALSVGLLACSGSPTTAASTGTTSESLRGTVETLDTDHHRLTLKTANGQVEAEWREPQVRHGELAQLQTRADVLLEGHTSEHAFEVETIDMHPELDDRQTTQPGDDRTNANANDDKGAAQQGDDRGAVSAGDDKGAAQAGDDRGGRASH